MNVRALIIARHLHAKNAMIRDGTFLVVLSVPSCGQRQS